MKCALTAGMRCVLLTALVAVSASVCAEPFAWAVNSRGNDADSQRVDALWRVDLANGSAEYVGWTSFLDLEAIALDDQGTLFGADDDSKTLVRISQTSGLAIPVGGVSNRSNMGVSAFENLDFGMSLDCAGQAYVVSNTRESLYLADLETGELTLVGASGSLGAPITDLAIRGDQAFGIGVGLNANGSTAAPELYAIDLDTATAELVGPLGSAANPYNNAGLAFDDEGTLWAMTDRRAVPGGDFPSEILRIDPVTGQAEKVADSIVGFESLAIAPTGGCGRGSSAALGVSTLSQSALVLMALLAAFVGLVQLRTRQP